MISFNNDRNCVVCNRKHDLFKTLSDEELKMINNGRYEINYKPNETIVKQGTSISHFIIIHKGVAKLYIEGKNKDMIMQYLRSPDFFLDPGAFVDKRNHFTLTALEETGACLIDVNVFLSLLQSNKAFAMEYFQEISKRELFFCERVMNLTQKQMHGRIADALLYLCNEIYNHNGKVIRISKIDLASVTNMNKDSAGRILKEFQESGVIKVNGNEIELLDLNTLRQICEYG